MFLEVYIIVYIVYNICFSTIYSIFVVASNRHAPEIGDKSGIWYFEPASYRQRGGNRVWILVLGDSWSGQQVAIISRPDVWSVGGCYRAEVEMEIMVVL